MSDFPFDPAYEDDEYTEIDSVLTIVTGKLIRGSDAQDMLNWAQQSLPRLMPTLFAHIPPEDHRQFAYWLGVGLWNIAPLPGNRFRPRPLEKPSRNAPCPCGSGLKFKQCCHSLPPLPQLAQGSDIFWPYFALNMPKAQLLAHAKEGTLPATALLVIGQHFLESGDTSQVVKMLEPLFIEQADRLNHQHIGLLDLLAEAYNAHYRTDRKKEQLLAHMTQHKDRYIRSEAWQRTATWRHDMGDRGGAYQALAEAMRANPDDPSHAALEITLLLAERNHARASERADFWLRKLRRQADEIPELIGFLETTRSDPQAALGMFEQGIGEDDRLVRILEWVMQLPDTPLPDYWLDFVKMDDIDGRPAVLLPPKKLERLERRWHQLTPTGKPFSVQRTAFGTEDFWYEEAESPWLEFIEQETQSTDSLTIMDDLVTLLQSHPDIDTPNDPMFACTLLLERAVAIIRQTVDADEQIRLPWLIEDNRPPLRLLAHAISYRIFPSDAENEALLKLYLRLNPNDNHGMRILLMNNLLQCGDDLGALALSADYPDDIAAELLYGTALAHYRRGERQAADHTLSLACQQLPLVADYLVKARVAQPEIEPGRYYQGGEDQAFLYREAMRPVWQDTPGALDWLKKQRGKHPKP